MSKLSRRGVLRLVGSVPFSGLWLAGRSSCLGKNSHDDQSVDGKSQTSRGRTFYVGAAGNDSASGSKGSPFKSITGALKAVSDLGANDTLVVMPGTYNEHVMVNKGGDQSGYFTLRSQVKHGALIRSPGETYSAINIIKNFIVVDGFDVQAGGTGHGIEATFIDGNPANHGPHHIKIVNNICHNNAGSGIGVAYGDFFTIDGNICYDNCHTNGYQGSGISIYEARAISDQTPGIHNFVRNNISCWNIALDLPGDPEPPHSDANGIIIDDFHNSQTRAAPNYIFGTLVENNVVNNNGGKGIQIYLSDNVVVRNNTSYHNNRDPLNPGTWRGELNNALASNNLWVNNIGVADPATNSSNTAISDHGKGAYVNQKVLWCNNLTFNGDTGEPSVFISGSNSSLIESTPYNNIFGRNPLFIDASDSITTPNFRLQTGSPAIGSGTTFFGIGSRDLDGKPRGTGRVVDIGAYETPPLTLESLLEHYLQRLGFVLPN